MAVPPKISFRLTPALQAALDVRVSQGQRASDVIREALEGYLGVRPTVSPTHVEVSDLVSDALSDLSGRVAALTTAVLEIEARLERLEARPTDQPSSDTPSDAIAMLSDRLEALASDMATGHERLTLLEGRMATAQQRVRQRPPAQTPTAGPPRPPIGQRKLTATQVRELRRKRARGTPMKVLMQEYGISKATLFRYLAQEQ